MKPKIGRPGAAARGGIRESAAARGGIRESAAARGGIMERDPAWLKPGPLSGPPQFQFIPR